MVTRSRLTGLLAIGFATGVLLVGTLSGVSRSAENPDPGRVAKISNAEALAKVADMSGLDARALAIAGTVDGIVSKALMIRGPGVEAAVDVSSGQVGYLTFFDRVPNTKVASLDQSQALPIARQFTGAHAVDVTGLTPEFERLDHLDFIEYRVTWSARMKGVLVPNQRIISINPETGQIYALVNINRAFATPPTPTVTADQATAIAVATIEGPAHLESSDLVIRFSKVGKQLLVWSLGFRQGDPGGYVSGQHVSVDALTGEVLPD